MSRSAASWGSGVVFEDGLDLGFGDHACQAVAAEQQAVAVDQGDVVLVDDDLGLGADRARQDVAVRVGAGLLRA